MHVTPMRLRTSARISPRLPSGQVRRLIALYQAASAGRFQFRAEIASLAGTAEGTDHGAEIDALVAKIDALDQCLAAAELVGELALQTAEGGLRVGLTALRGNLHSITTATGRGIGGRRRRHPGRRRGGALWRRRPGWRRRLPPMPRPVAVVMLCRFPRSAVRPTRRPPSAVCRASSPTNSAAARH